MHESVINPIYLKAFNDFRAKARALADTEDVFVLPQKAGVKKDVLFLAGTHGDEPLGIELMSLFGADKAYDWLVANEKAVTLNQRFVDCDLNRSAPGAFGSDKYEERRAAEILLKVKSYNYVVDVHNHSLSTRTFIILTKPSFADLLLAAQFDISDIVVWLPSERRNTGPLTEFFEPAIEIEANRQDKERLIVSVKRFIGQYALPITKNNLIGKNIYWVYGKQFKKAEGWRDFEATRVGGEEFYPFMCGQYSGIGCYKMMKIL